MDAATTASCVVASVAVVGADANWEIFEERLDESQRSQSQQDSFTAGFVWQKLTPGGRTVGLQQILTHPNVNELWYSRLSLDIHIQG